MREKGVFRLLDAMAILGERGVAARLEVVGDGPDLAEARAAAGSRGLPVDFAGRLEPDALSARYREASLFCFPSTHAEGLPSVLVEAVAHGLPVITLPSGGIADVLRDGEHGILLRDADPATLADAVAGLLADADTREAMARRNHVHGRERFLASAAAARMDRLYAGLMGA
jgi:glycosyltransferase involved in cell wall biosynthesis